MVLPSRPLPRVAETAEASDPTGRIQAVVIRSLQRDIVKLRARYDALGIAKVKASEPKPKSIRAPKR